MDYARLPKKNIDCSIQHRSKSVQLMSASIAHETTVGVVAMFYDQSDGGGAGDGGGRQVQVIYMPWCLVKH